MGETQKRRIDFTPNQKSGWDALGGGTQEAFNVVVDGNGTVRRRPGIAEWFSTAGTVVHASGLSGIHITSDGNVYASGGHPSVKDVYRLRLAGATHLGQLNGTVRPTWAETQTLLVLAAGGVVKKVSKSTDIMAGLEGVPTVSTHVVAHASRLAVKDDANKSAFYYSALSQGTDEVGFELWNAAPDPRYSGVASDSAFFTAEARPDPIVALHENTNEIFAFCSTNTQSFLPDPQAVYSRGVTREFGCSAPYSVIKDDQSFAWLDHKRRFVHSDGRTFNFLSDPIKQSLDDMATVSDCFGYRVVNGPTDALVWTFPSDGRTFAYQRGGGWSQWSGWSGNHEQMSVTCAAQSAIDGKTLVGTSAGRVGTMRHSAPDDLGTAIRACVTTGFIDHDTVSRKHCKAVRLVIRRGTSTNAQAPAAILEYRDSLGPWRLAGNVSLGRIGDPQVVVQLRSLGVYRERQWRFTFSGTEDLALADVEEEVEALGT